MEAPIISDMVVVGMRIKHTDRQFGQPFNYGFYISYSHSRVEQDCFLSTDDEIRDHFFKLMRLINGENPRTNFVHLEPLVWNLHPFKIVVSRSRLALAAVRCLRGSGY